VDTIISYYGDLINKLKYKTNAHIVCTSILPCLCDHDKTVNKINKVNLESKKLCIRKKIQYTNLYRSFLPGNACVVHPLIPSTYFGIDAEIIVALFSW
jgi:hypothetical protein